MVPNLYVKPRQADEHFVEIAKARDAEGKEPLEFYFTFPNDSFKPKTYARADNYLRARLEAAYK